MKKSASRSKKSRPRLHYLKLSEQELEIMHEESEDSQAAGRNWPLFSELMKNDPELSCMLYDPALLPILMFRHVKQIQASQTLAGGSAGQEEFLRSMMESLKPHFNAPRVMNDLIGLMKRHKIKREKRLLLWAIGDLMQVVYNKATLGKSVVFQAFVTTSIDYSMQLSQTANQIREGGEPYRFHYEDYLVSPIPVEKYNQWFDTFGHRIDSLHRVMSLWSMELFERIKKPFGLRFYQVIHFPFQHLEKKSKLIFSPGESESALSETITRQEKYEAITRALFQDFYTLSLPVIIRQVVQSLRATAFGEVDPQELNHQCNAVAFSLLFPYLENMFRMTLYEKSAEQAEELNPEDERTDIIEIKNAPDNPRAYLRYAETLAEKEEWEGAFHVHRRAGKFMDQPDEAWTRRLKELEEKLPPSIKEEIQRALAVSAI